MKFISDVPVSRNGYKTESNLYKNSYTGCLKKNCAVGVLVTEETIFVQGHYDQGVIRKLYISVIS